ncbi:glycosyltransferase family A protein [Thiocystis minor]|uniref:glycosyltransferase family A protein n=1 Tax=Thiocystis minor TaxID=61597 RepID=UPI0019142122|nr:glycosyltransferase family A protein [Thiocystis minor]
MLREPGNVTEARQRGAEVVRTDWLLFSDADVVFAPDYFVALARLHETTVDYGPKLSRDRYRAYYRGFALGQSLCQTCGIPPPLVPICCCRARRCSPSAASTGA